MSKINILSEHLSNKIAAGEVIERPASVVKELVENAIDAGATSISIRIERAGTKLIQVVDNGLGMDSEDALLSLEPHGTSKIRNDEDIENIITLGFRGEAIPSIASISRFTIRTRTANDLEGTIVEVEGGKIQNSGPVGCAVGTSMEVRDLFFNTPVRKKFLKSPATESHHIEEMIIMLALPYPEISFELILDNRTAIHSPAAESLTSRLRDFFGRNFAEQMLPVEHKDSGVLIHGFVAAPGFTRTSRREQRTFVNGRGVESQAIYRGIRDGYSTMSDSGRFPPTVLFIQMDPTQVDVNVHPAKREVRFRQEFIISRALSTAVSNALKGRSTPSSTLDYKVPMESFIANTEIAYTPQPEIQEEFFEEEIAPEESPNIVPEIKFVPPVPLQKEPISSDCNRTETLETPRPMPSRIVFSGDWPTEVLGVIDKTFIVASGQSGLILIDQHAAHERVMFEKLQRATDQGVPAQTLLLPLTVELPRSSANLLWRYKEEISKLGFDLESMGNTTVMINAIPAVMPTNNLESMLLDMLTELVENAAAKLPMEQEFIARAACKAAIKAHDNLTLELAKQLLKELSNCNQGTLCPHGRPTMLSISTTEIARRFGRK